MVRRHNDATSNVVSKAVRRYVVYGFCKNICRVEFSSF